MDAIVKPEIDGSQPFTNPRQEAFAVAFAALNVQGDAYQQAGYKPRSLAAARSAASRLLTNVDMQARVQWLRAEAAKNFEITPDRVTRMLLQAYEIASGARQSSAMVAACRELAVIAGFRVERKTDDGPSASKLGQLTAEAIFDRLEQIKRRRAGSITGSGTTGQVTSANGSGQLRLVSGDSGRP